MTAEHFICLLLLTALSACSSHPAAVRSPVGPEPAPPERGTGDLVVYSATYASTVEQGDYPVHTNYTIATAGDRLIERVANRSGPFAAYPAAVVLPSGEYHVRAQYNRGGFVMVPVVIEPGKTTVVDLDGEVLPQQADITRDKVLLPDGQVVGWRGTSPAPAR